MLRRGRRRTRDTVGHRIAEQQAEEGRDRRDLERIQVGTDVQRVGKQVVVVPQMQPQRQHLVVDPTPQRLIRRDREHRLRERDAEHDDERHHEKQHQPDHRHGRHQRLANPVIADVRRPARRPQPVDPLPERFPRRRQARVLADGAGRRARRTARGYAHFSSSPPRGWKRPSSGTRLRPRRTARRTCARGWPG